MLLKRHSETLIIKSFLIILILAIFLVLKRRGDVELIPQTNQYVTQF